jgi:hypothetical protein
MNPVKGHYSIVQYCPDLARRETVNIGVVLLVPQREFLQTRMVADNERVRHFFGTTGDDAKLLSEFKKSFSDRIEAEHGRVTTLETFQKFIDTRGNQIQLTEPAFVKVRDCQETLTQLFDQLVGGKVKQRNHESFPSLETYSKIENTESYKGHRDKDRGTQGSVLSVTLCFKKILRFFRNYCR